MKACFAYRPAGNEPLDESPRPKRKKISHAVERSQASQGRTILKPLFDGKEDSKSMIARFEIFESMWENVKDALKVCLSSMLRKSPDNQLATSICNQRKYSSEDQSIYQE